MKTVFKWDQRLGGFSFLIRHEPNATHVVRGDRASDPSYDILAIAGHPLLITIEGQEIIVSRLPE